ncbi:hypothetical protein C2G38_2215501 [Gigaspora rosea]|uniref:SAP domain-containing protein n=1 Tax=Gigaspora rosea TaxID=44941 RepID=A0A397UIC0_9GLOM|nr:hypothetical protein C2G38_2215501 [Gigaspora rosea]CAG8797964.1 21276_t:CDS:1 [Gigaspora rosea]
MTEETQQTNTDLEGETTTSQVEATSMVNWNRLQLTDLRTKCLRCNIPAEGTKTELVNCLESYWKELENEYEPQGPSKGKSVEQTQTESYEKRDGHPTQEGIDGQNYAFLSYIEDRLEEKIEEK